MIPKKLKEIQLVVLLEGCGSGSKLFQNLLDNHSNILMIPEYNLMYFYPHWSETKNIYNLKKRINFIVSKHKKILEIEKKINQKFFEKKIFYYLNNEKLNSKNFLIAYHLAYAECQRQNIRKKKVLVYHAHVNSYLDYIKKDFKKSKIIFMTREVEENFARRVLFSINKPNDKHFNYTDSTIINLKSYLELIIIYSKFILFTNFKEIDNCVLINFQTLKKNQKKILRNFCKFAGIIFSKNMNKPTINGKTWKVRENPKGKINEHTFFYERIWLNIIFRSLNAIIIKKNYNINFSKFFLAFLYLYLPTKNELNNFTKFFNYKFIFFFLKKIIKEKKKNIYYNLEKNSFYKYKWTNIYVPIKFLNKINALTKIKIIGIYFFVMVKIFYIPLGIIFTTIFYIIRVLITNILLIYSFSYNKKYPNFL